MTEKKIYTWYALAIFDKDDDFTYIGLDGEDYGYHSLEFDTLEEAEEYREDCYEPGIVILKETRQIVG